MTTLALDTHKFITRLKDAGMDEKQAVAIVEGLKEVENLVTKEDLRVVIAELKSDLYKSGLYALLGQAALIVALIELLGK